MDHDMQQQLDALRGGSQQGRAALGGLAAALRDLRAGLARIDGTLAALSARCTDTGDAAPPARSPVAAPTADG